MAYWITVCNNATDPGVSTSGAPNCAPSSMVSMEVQLMVVPPAGSGYDGFWQLASLSVDDAEVILAGVFALWAVVWGFRKIADYIERSGGVGPDE